MTQAAVHEAEVNRAEVTKYQMICWVDVLANFNRGLFSATVSS